jgi:hypothetical protein
MGLKLFLMDLDILDFCYGLLPLTQGLKLLSTLTNAPRNWSKQRREFMLNKEKKIKIELTIFLLSFFVYCIS